MTIGWEGTAIGRQARLAATLVAAVFAADLIWHLAAGSTGSIFYAVVDWPAHLATCGIALLAVVTVTGWRVPERFLLGALVGSVAIDIDHLPNYLGSQVLTGSLPRPYTHSLLVIALILCLARVLRGNARQIALGAAFGVLTHLLRDLATGPGVPLFWPISAGVVVVPYEVYALVLVAALLAVLGFHRWGRRYRAVGGDRRFNVAD